MCEEVTKTIQIVRQFVAKLSTPLARTQDLQLQADRAIFQQHPHCTGILAYSFLALIFHGVFKLVKMQKRRGLILRCGVWIESLLWIRPTLQ